MSEWVPENADYDMSTITADLTSTVVTTLMKRSGCGTARQRFSNQTAS
jgi:hypothetical protein